MSSAFALYRLPHADRYVKVQGSTRQLLSCTLLNGLSGFVVAPFQVTPEQPIVVIDPEQVESEKFKVNSEEFAAAIPSAQASCLVGNSSLFTFPSSLKTHYHIDFANYHAQLCQGTFRKIVLARCADEVASSPVEPEQLFLRACSLYPRMFIALVSTPQSGVWLTATPEILLEGDGTNWRTIALAGTMKLEGSQLAGEGETVRWSTKNIEEQCVVATYIAECLEHFTGDFTEEGPRTVRAANLVHLRSDFTFTLPSPDCLGNLLHELHPTPAVCGLPKREAFQFIVRHEHTPRRYYSGFMGPLNMEDTHLYVSLRCMNIDDGVYHLYAGGGLLKDSIEEQEWLETEAKLETMRQCIAANPK